MLLLKMSEFVQQLYTRSRDSALPHNLIYIPTKPKSGGLDSSLRYMDQSLRMNDVLDDVHESLLHGEERVARSARWFYEDFTCVFH